MRKSIIILLFFLALQAGLFAVDNLFTTQLEQKLKVSDSNEFIQINIRLAEQFDSNRLRIEAQELPKSQRRDFVIAQLKNFSQNSQMDLLTLLRNGQRDGEVKDIIPLWITNLINCKIKKTFITNLINRTDIDRVDYDEMRNMLIDAKKEENTSNRDREITWNVTHVDADDVWGLGYTGSGVLVAVLDTGLNYNHHDIQNQLWNGGASYPHHGYDFVNNDDDPWDEGGNANGHGTHCAGTVAGDGTSGSQTGVAPDASIMALKILSGDGSGTESGVWNAIQCCVDHNVDVMSMSVGWQHSWGVDRQSWRNSMVNALSAGVVAAVAAGNEGDEQSSYPIPDNVRSPGDCPPPWLNPDQTLTGGLSCVVTVGASTSSDDLSYFSSLGPVTWENVTGYNDYAHNPEMGLIRPDITAPGSNIKSLDYQNVSGYLDGWSGTSMATPCVAGIMALMLSKNPDLTPAQIDQILEETVTNATNPKNNQFGSGIANALNAVNAVSVGQFPSPTNLTAVKSGTSVNLSWDAPSRALSSYKIYRNSAYLATTSSAVTTYTDSNLSGGATYTYYVTAVYTSPNGESGTSNTASVTFPNTIPFNEDFVDAAGWMQQNDGCTSRWSSSSTNNAGGNSPEIKASWESANPATTRLVSPALDTQGMSLLNLSFKHYYDYYSGSDITIRIQSSADASTWTNEAWVYVNPANDIGPITENTTIAHNLGNITYIAWVISGNLYNFDNWYIDDVSVVVPYPVFSVSPDSLGFNNVLLGEYTSKIFTIYNDGPTTLTGVITPPADYYVYANTLVASKDNIAYRDTLGFNVSAHQSKNYIVYFYPATTGLKTGTITFTSNDPNHSPEIAVSGTGYLNSPENVTVTISGNNVVIDWTYNNKVTIYHVYGSDRPDSGFVELGTIPQGPFTILNGASSQIKFYKVTAE